MVVTVWWTNTGEGFAFVRRFAPAHVEHVNGVFVFGVGINVGVVPCSLTPISIFVGLLPSSPSIIRFENPAVRRFDVRPISVWIDGRDRKPDFP